MKNKLLTLILSIPLVMTACTTLPNQSGNVYSNQSVHQLQQVYYGRIVDIQRSYVQSEGNILPTLGGAIIGGLLGNQIGGGSGKKVATVAGTIAGGYIGNETYKNYGSTREVKQITFSIDSETGNAHYTVLQADPNNQFYNGQRIKIIQQGNQVRIMP